MIYVSSSCVKNNTIKDSILELNSYGFNNIELSGGTEYYDGLENDLLELKDKYNLNFICHNYFPPPKEHFVLNLASLNDEIYSKTLSHLKNTITLSQKLSSKKFGFHAGFLVNISLNEIGKRLSRESLFNKTNAIQRFCDGYKELVKHSNGIELYVENNVFSHTNHQTFCGENIFMLTNFSEYTELAKKIDYNLLLDVAHLKVSCNTLGLNFENEFSNLVNKTNYLHISDNDGLHDLNEPLQRESQLLQLLQQTHLNNKDITLEIYDSLDNIQKSYTLLEKVIYE